MNKIIKAIGAFMAMMMIITPAMGMTDENGEPYTQIDDMGREYVNIDENIYYYNQTVYIHDMYGSSKNIYKFENCTVKIDTSGQITYDGEKAPAWKMKYGYSSYYKGMAWNDFPTMSGQKFSESPMTTGYRIIEME